jgi:hypothetical protein
MVWPTAYRSPRIACMIRHTRMTQLSRFLMNRISSWQEVPRVAKEGDIVISATIIIRVELFA